MNIMDTGETLNPFRDQSIVTGSGDTKRQRGGGSQVLPIRKRDRKCFSHAEGEGGGRYNKFWGSLNLGA